MRGFSQFLIILPLILVGVIYFINYNNDKAIILTYSLIKNKTDYSEVIDIISKDNIYIDKTLFSHKTINELNADLVNRKIFTENEATKMIDNNFFNLTISNMNEYKLKNVYYFNYKIKENYQSKLKKICEALKKTKNKELNYDFSFQSCNLNNNEITFKISS